MTQMQHAGGVLLPPVRTLVASSIFAKGKNENESPADHSEGIPRITEFPVIARGEAPWQSPNLPRRGNGATPRLPPVSFADIPPRKRGGRDCNGPTEKKTGVSFDTPVGCTL